MNDNNLQALSSLVDFVKNPDYYKGLIDSLNKATADNKASLNALTQGKSIQDFNDSTKKELDQMQADLESATQSQADSFAAKQKMLADRVATLTDRENAVSKKEADLTAREAGLVPKETAVQQMKDEVQSKLDDLAKQASDLDARDQALQAKADQLKKLLG